MPTEHRTHVELEQGSLAWHLYRAEHCNASEAAIVMGKAPAYWGIKTLYQLKQAKSGLLEDDFEENYATAHGKKYESEAVAALGEALGVDWSNQPGVFEYIMEDGLPLSASVDAFTEDSGNSDVIVGEVKCPVKGITSETWKAVMAGKVPDHYLYQLAHIAIATNCKTIVFAAFIPREMCQEDDDLLAYVELDGEDLRNTHGRALLPKWRDFWFAKEIPPDEAPPLDADMDEWQLLAEEYLGAKAQEAAAKKAQTRIKERLEAIAGNANFSAVEGGSVDCIKACGIALTYKTRKGNVDYKAVPELDGVDLDKYRKPGIAYTEIREVKE